MKNNDRVPGTHQKEAAYITHPRGHWSDLLALYLLKRYGKRQVFLNEAEARRAGWTGPIDVIGRGTFDEHDDPTLIDVEATLAAKQLGIAENYELQRLLAYTLSVDREGQSKGVLRIGRIVELLYDAMPESQWHRVLTWVEVFIEAYLDEWLDRTPPASLKSEEVIDLIWQAYHNVEGEFSDLEKTELAEILAAYHPAMEFEPFRLPMCVAVIWRRWRKIGIRKSPLTWVEDALRAELVKQRLFFASPPEFENGFISEMTVSDKPAVVLGCTTENRYVHSFAFSRYGEEHFGNVVAAVVRRPNGHTMVCRKPRGEMVELWSVVAQVRAHEQEIRGLPVSTWNELLTPRGPVGAGCWFFQQKAQRLMNGALTALDIEPTQQSLEDVWHRLAWGIADDQLGYRRQFYLERGGKVE